MTEAEWLASHAPEAMLRCILLRAKPRKLRLFQCARCRGVWNYLPDGVSREAVIVAERYADGGASRRHLQAAREAAEEVFKDWRGLANEAAGWIHDLRMWARPHSASVLRTSGQNPVGAGFSLRNPYAS